MHGVVQILVLQAYLVFFYACLIGSDFIHLMEFPRVWSMMRCIACQNRVKTHNTRLAYSKVKTRRLMFSTVAFASFIAAEIVLVIDAT